MKAKALTVQIIAILFFTSCQQSPQEKLIQDYVETIGDTKTDLSFNVKSLEKIGEITGKDSVQYLLVNGLGENDARISLLDTGIALYTRKYELFDSLTKVYDGKYEVENSKVDKNHGLIILYLETAGDYEKDAMKYKDKLEPLTKLKDQISAYDNKQNEVLATKWKCTYTIKNPLLNNAEQELTKIFILSPENSKVFGSEKSK